MVSKRTAKSKVELSGDAAGELRVVADQSDYSLPAWIYSNPEFFKLERKHIFAQAWHLVCHVSDIPEPGDYHTMKVMDETLFVVRGKDREVRAFYNVCRHRAARLLDGDKGHCPGRITCPYHAWSYGLDGKLVGVPERDEYERIDFGANNLEPLEFDIFMGFVCVRLEAGRTSISEFMAPVQDELALYRIEELKPLGRVNQHMRDVNWKNGVDNYIDALHVRAAHPGLNSLIGKTYTLEDRGIVFRLSGEADHFGRASLSARTYSKYVPKVDYLPKNHRKLWLYLEVVRFV